MLSGYIAPNTKVLLNNGSFISACEIKIGDIVKRINISFDETSGKIVYISNQLFPKVLQISLLNGRNIIITSSQKILVKRNNKYVFIEGSDLTMYDEVIIEYVHSDGLKSIPSNISEYYKYLQSLKSTTKNITSKTFDERHFISDNKFNYPIINIKELNNQQMYTFQVANSLNNASILNGFIVQ